MILPTGGVKIVVATTPIDFRRGINGLVAIVVSALAADPYCGDVFIFRPRRADRLRLIFWDGSGMVLATKWLEGRRFARPAPGDGTMVLTREEFALLLAGLDWTKARRPAVKRPVYIS